MSRDLMNLANTQSQEAMNAAYHLQMMSFIGKEYSEYNKRLQEVRQKIISIRKHMQDNIPWK